MTRGRVALPRLDPTRVVWLCAALAVLAYAPSLLDGFVHDDLPLVRDNPYAHDVAHLGRCFTTDLWDTPAHPARDSTALFYRPLVCASFVVDWEVGRGAPWLFHLTNLVLHAAASALAARVALRWTRSLVAGLVTAAVLAVHPSHTENVIWVSGRADLVMAVALLGATELAARAARAAGRVGTWALAFGAFCCALLAKESAVFWPLFLSVEATIAGDRGRDERRRRLLIAGGAALACVVLYLTFRARLLPLHAPELQTLALPPAMHASCVLLAIGYYAERLFFPWPQTFHFRPPAFADGTPTLFWPSVALGAVVALAIAAWLVAAWRRDATAALIIAVSVLVTLPVLNPTSTGFRTPTADRVLYLPSLLFVLAAARHGRRRLEAIVRTARREALIAGVASTLVVFMLTDWARAVDHSSETTLWSRELQLHPDDPHALNALARAHAEASQLEQAAALYRRALTRGPLEHRTLANPTASYLGLVTLQGSRLADGHVSALSALLAHVVDLVRGAPLRSSGAAGDLELLPPPESSGDPHFRIHVANAAAALARAGTLVASRIGRDDLSRLLVASLGEDAPLDVTARYDLALALVRGGDYSGARRQLALARRARLSPEAAQALDGLQRTIESVKELRLRASSLPEPARSLARGRAFLELGAPLRAARALRDAYQVAPGDAAVRAAYLEALCGARLTAEARAIAERGYGAEATAHLDEAERRLTASAARALPPPPTERWWPRPAGSREE